MDIAGISLLTINLVGQISELSTPSVVAIAILVALIPAILIGASVDGPQETSSKNKSEAKSRKIEKVTCPRCKTENRGTASFCDQCGKDLT